MRASANTAWETMQIRHGSAFGSPGPAKPPGYHGIDAGQCRIKVASHWRSGALSSEVTTGLREESPSKQESRAPLRLHRNGRLQGPALRPGDFGILEMYP